MQFNFMNLPVSNKYSAYLRNAFLLIILLIIFSTLYIYFQNISILKTLFFVSILVIVCLFISQRKQNIKSLEFAKNKLIASYNKRKIEIPISQIEEIIVGFSLGLNFRFTTTMH